MAGLTKKNKGFIEKCKLPSFWCHQLQQVVNPSSISKAMLQIALPGLDPKPLQGRHRQDARMVLIRRNLKTTICLSSGQSLLQQLESHVCRRRDTNKLFRRQVGRDFY